MATPDAPQAMAMLWNVIDVSDRATGFGFTRSVNIQEETYADSGQVSRAPGSGDAQFRITPGMDDDAHVSSQYWFGEVGTERVLEMRPNDTVQGVGNPQLDGSAFVSEHAVDFTAGGDAAQSLTFAVNGALTWAEA